MFASDFLFYSFTADPQFPHLLLRDILFLLTEYDKIAWLCFLSYNHSLVSPYTEITTRLDFKCLSEVTSKDGYFTF